MTHSIEKQAEELAARPYIEVVFRDRTTDDEYIYVAYNPELKGCVVQGETVEEARENLGLFRIDYIQHLLEHNLPVPAPNYISAICSQETELLQPSAHQPLSGEELEVEREGNYYHLKGKKLAGVP